MARKQKPPQAYRLPDDVKEWLDAKATALGITRTSILVGVLRAYMRGDLVKAKGATILADL